MKFIKAAISPLRHKSAHAVYRQTYERFRQYTMIPPGTFAANLELAERAMNLDGCVVECGVWRGGMSAAIASVLGGEREYFLFDSFKGLPKAKEIDGIAALKWQQNTDDPNYYDNCTAEPEYAEQAMHLAGVRHFRLVQGWFENTIPGYTFPSPIALLRLDADWYDSTMICLDHLFPQVAPSGIIILDDYYTWDGCSRALHDYLSRHSASERIRSHKNVCYLQKASGSLRDSAGKQPEQ